MTTVESKVTIMTCRIASRSFTIWTKLYFYDVSFDEGSKGREYCWRTFLEVMEQDQYLNTTETFDLSTTLFWWVRRRQFFCFKDDYRRNRFRRNKFKAVVCEFCEFWIIFDVFDRRSKCNALNQNVCIKQLP